MLNVHKHLPSLVTTRYGGPCHENVAVCDLPGFAELAERVPHGARRGASKWNGGQSFGMALEYVRHGDMSSVAASDQLLSQFEHLVPASKAWQTFNSVCGGAPDVPAYLAGHPTNMRQRRRIVAETAPLSVFVELTNSAAISASDARRRGIAILAFVRLLSNIRPVELWACVALGLGSETERSSVLIRIDTAPLDLARAAHVLTSTAVFRCLGYQSLQQEFMTGGAWPFGSYDKHARTAGAAYAAAANPGSESMYIPGVIIGDELVSDSVGWLKRTLAAHGAEMGA